MQTDNHDTSDAQSVDADPDADEESDVATEHAIAQATGAVFEGESGRAGEL